MKNYKNISLFSIAAMVISTLMVLLYQKPSYAAFTTCNRTNRKIYVAVAYYDQTSHIGFNYVKSDSIDKVGPPTWKTRGWFHISPGECKNILPKNLKHLPFIYTYADSASGGAWKGKHSFCVSTTNEFYLTLDAKKGTKCENQFENYRYREKEGLSNLGFFQHRLPGRENYTWDATY